MGLFAATAARSSPRLLLAGALARVRAQARSLSASAQPAMPLGASWRAEYLSAPAVVFHKTHCSLCRDLVERLEDALDAKSVREVALDKLPNRGDALREVQRDWPAARALRVYWGRARQDRGCSVGAAPRGRRAAGRVRARAQIAGCGSRRYGPVPLVTFGVLISRSRRLADALPSLICCQLPVGRVLGRRDSRRPSDCQFRRPQTGTPDWTPVQIESHHSVDLQRDPPPRRLLLPTGSR